MPDLWHIEKTISKGDYLYALVRGHPNATKNGYVLYHRVVMENFLGRILLPGEVVHHLNEDKKDNRVENLQVLSKQAHREIHLIKGRAMVALKCPKCEIIFHKEKRQSFLNGFTQYTCCSPQCGGKFSRYTQLHGKTQEVTKAMSENLQYEYTTLL